MSNPSKEKGTRAETDIKNILKKHTGLGWERTPLSGALDPKHGLKSDLYIPNEHNIYTVECKHYKDNHFNTSLFTSINPQLIEWWTQVKRQAIQTDKKPLLLFKYDRSKIFAAYEEMPNTSYRIIFASILGYEFYISLLEDWLTNERPRFIL
jgi:Holliday junction resolvase